MRHNAQGATGVWVVLGLVFKWFPSCEFSLFYTPGNGTPLQYSFLENPMDGEAW